MQDGQQYPPKGMPLRGQVAWAAIHCLHQDGPSACTATAVAKLARCARRSVYTHLGSDVVAAVVGLLHEQMHLLLSGIDPSQSWRERAMAVARALVPPQHHRAYAWAVALGGWEAEERLAKSVTAVLGDDAGEFAYELGTGVLGVVRASLLSGYPHTRDELAAKIATMTLRVEAFEFGAPSPGSSLA